MVRDKPLHNFFFEHDDLRFFDRLDCFATPWIDTCVILHLARFRRPQRFLEIGTHRGFTTRILAERFPEMEIVTVDPGDQVAAQDRPDNQINEYLRQEQIGELVRDHANVEIIKKPFQDIDWGDQRFEMIFVDGNHERASVLKDSHLAMRLVTDPGVIIWHDFNNVRGVNEALDQLHTEKPVVTLHNTWIAYLDTH
jgi:predicted O-methyltransferase YrrM